MYDWANSAFATIILTAIFPVYYRALATRAGVAPADATAYWAYTTAFSLLLVAVIGPLLGAMADIAGGRKRFLGAALGAGVFGSLGLAFLGGEDVLLASILFAIANLGFAGGNIFYEALLPHIARHDDLDRVSARGYAFGYLGGGLLLIVNTLWLVRPEWFFFASRESALRACFASVGLWWLIFALPLLLRVPEPSVCSQRLWSGHLAIDGLRRLQGTIKEIRRYRELALFLVAFWIYNDGIGTIIKLAAAYGDEMGLGHNDILIALIVTQLIGFPSSIGFGSLAQRIGAKHAILFGLAVYSLVSAAGFFLRSAWHFYALAIVVGLVQGGTQALSRSLFATMAPKTHSSEFFGFFSTGEKVAGIFGPAIFGLLAQLTGSSRWGIVSLVVLFFTGAWFLFRVDEEAAGRVARSMEAP
jgi:UMF1 family MFS transporter